jgi:hypothetical protein
MGACARTGNIVIVGRVVYGFSRDYLLSSAQSMLGFTILSSLLQICLANEHFFAN